MIWQRRIKFHSRTYALFEQFEQSKSYSLLFRLWAHNRTTPQNPHSFNPAVFSEGRIYFVVEHFIYRYLTYIIHLGCLSTL